MSLQGLLLHPKATARIFLTYRQLPVYEFGKFFNQERNPRDNLEVLVSDEECSQDIRLTPTATQLKPTPRIFKLRKYIMDMNHDAGTERRQDFEEDEVDVTPALAHMRRVNEENISRLKMLPRSFDNILHPVFIYSYVT